MTDQSIVIDVIALAILLAAIALGAYRGIIKSIFQTFSSVISLVIAYTLHPILTKLVIATPLFDMLKENTADKLGLSITQTASTQSEQIQIITGLPLPDFLTEMLIDNNNTVVHELLDSHGIADYICGYIANLMISIAVTLLLIISMKLIVRGISASLDIMSRLPVIHQLNQLGGGIVGAISGILLIWIIMLVSVLFVADSSYSYIQETIDGSVLCKILYDNNILISLIMGDLF